MTNREFFYNDLGTFTLLQFTDLHLGAKPWNELDNKTLNLIKRALIAEKPDLIVMTGDNIWTHGVENALEVYKDLLCFFDSLEVPYGLTYGNHDSEDQVTRKMLHDTEVGARNLIINGEVYHGDRRTYHIDLHKRGEDKKSSKPCHRVILLDSGDYGKFGLYGATYKEQNEYVAKISKEAQNSLLFLHIPLVEYWEGLDKIESGVRLEENKKISSAETNSGLFHELLHFGNVKGIYCGHDHDNNFTFRHFGMELGYGNVSGYNCYGTLKRGYRKFILKDDGTYENSIITEDMI